MSTRRYLLALFASCCVTSVVCAATYTVNYLADLADTKPGDGICAGNGNPNYCTLRAAVQTANAHVGADTIVVPGGTYVLSLHGSGEDAAATGDLDITDSVTIQAQTAGIIPTIDGDGADRIFDIGSTNSSIKVTLFGLRLTHGVAGPAGTAWGEQGGAIRAGGHVSHYLTDLNVNYCIIDNNVADEGGGIYAQTFGAMSMQYVLLTANQSKQLSATSEAGNGSAAHLDADNITLSHIAVVTNLPDPQDPGTGSALLTLGRQTLRISDSTIAANAAIGVDVFAAGGSAYLDNVSVLDNHTGMYVYGSGSTSTALTIRNSIFAGNTRGGGSDCSLRQGSGGLTIDASDPNIDSDGSCHLDTSSGGMPNTSMAALRLAPLGYYGLAPSRPPMPGSVAIDRGSSVPVTGESDDPSCGASDQNGNARPFDGDSDGNAVCDIGAIEYHGDLIFVDGLEPQ